MDESRAASRIQRFYRQWHQQVGGGGGKSNNRRCKRVVADWKFVMGEGREEGVH